MRPGHALGRTHRCFDTHTHYTRPPPSPYTNKYMNKLPPSLPSRPFPSFRPLLLLSPISYPKQFSRLFLRSLNFHIYRIYSNRSLCTVPCRTTSSPNSFQSQTANIRAHARTHTLYFCCMFMILHYHTSFGYKCSRSTGDIYFRCVYEIY